jgi:AcrR family transcriptional regulator
LVDWQFNQHCANPAMPRSETDNQEIRAARRREILAAATSVFADKGVARTKVTDIAAAANLSHGLLYHYFPSKEAVFEAIVDEMIARANEDLSSPHERAIDRLQHTLQRVRDRLADKSFDTQAVLTCAMLMRDSLSDEIRARLNAHLERVMDRTRETIALAQTEGDVDPSIDPEEATRVLMFLFRGMAIRVPDFTVPLPSVDGILQLLRPAERAVPKRAKRAGGRR